MLLSKVGNTPVWVIVLNGVVSIVLYIKKKK